MTDDDAVVLVTSLICRVRQVSPAQVAESARLVDDLGFDSLDAAELLAALHKATGRQFDLDSVNGMHTVRDIARGLVNQLDRPKAST